MIFSLYDRFRIRLDGGEEHVFDRGRLMYTEVAEIEKVTGLSYGEWERELGRHSITAIAALVHVLRRREGQASDFAAMQFNAAALEIAPLRDDGTEMSAADITADLARRMAEAAAGPGPTRGHSAAAGAQAPAPEAMTVTSPSSPAATTSARGSGNGSHGPTSSSSRRTLTPG